MVLFAWLSQRGADDALQGHRAHKKPPPPLGPPQGPRHGATVGSFGVAVSYERGTPVLEVVPLEVVPAEC